MMVSILCLSLTICYGGFKNVYLGIIPTVHEDWNVGKPTAEKRLCFVRGEKYSVMFDYDYAISPYFNRIEFTIDGYTKVFKRSELQISDDLHSIEIPVLDIPTSFSRGNFEIKLISIYPMASIDICYARIIEKGTISSIRFTGTTLPLKAGNKFILHPNIAYNLVITGDNLDHVSPMLEDWGISQVNYYILNRSNKETTVVIKHQLTGSDVIPDPVAWLYDESTIEYINYTHFPYYGYDRAADYPGTGGYETSLKDLVLGYGNSLLPDLVPAGFASPIQFFMPKANGVNLLDDGGNIYKELSPAFISANISSATVVSSVPVDISGMGAGKQYIINLPDPNYGVKNNGILPLAASAFDIRIKKYKSASDTIGVVVDEATVPAANFPPLNGTRQVLYTRPNVTVYSFASQPGKYFLKRVNDLTPGENEEFKFLIEVDFVVPVVSRNMNPAVGVNLSGNNLTQQNGKILEAKEDNNKLEILK